MLYSFRWGLCLVLNCIQNCFLKSFQTFHKSNWNGEFRVLSNTWYVLHMKVPFRNSFTLGWGFSSTIVSCILFSTYGFTIHKITKNLIWKVHLLSFCYQRWQMRILPIDIKVPNWYKNKQQQIEISTVRKHGNHMNMNNRFDIIVVELSVMARHSLDTSVLSLQ